MLIFLIEAAALCGVFTVSCVSLVRHCLHDPQLAVYSYPPDIIRRLIELGRIRQPEPIPEWNRVVKKLPASAVLGLAAGLLLRYVNGYGTFVSGFAAGYGLWLIGDWYDALVMDCLWFCRSPRCRIPGTEDMDAAYHDYAYHLKGSCLGMVLGLPFGTAAGLLCAFL